MRSGRAFTHAVNRFIKLQGYMDQILKNLGIDKDSNGLSTGQVSWEGSGREVTVSSPVDGKTIGTVKLASLADYEKVKDAAKSAFAGWRKMPAPQRGEIVRQYGDKLRQHKQDLGSLVSYEMGKSLQEGLGEVQEMIDICDFAVGLSRQLYGLQMHSERPNHRMFEQWHPLGTVGIISAFNFPVAVWSWNAALALVCGNVCLWKPSEKTPFSAIASSVRWRFLKYQRSTKTSVYCQQSHKHLEKYSLRSL